MKKPGTDMTVREYIDQLRARRAACRAARLSGQHRAHGPDRFAGGEAGAMRERRLMFA